MFDPTLSRVDHVLAHGITPRRSRRDAKDRILQGALQSSIPLSTGRVFLEPREHNLSNWDKNGSKILKTG